MKRAIGGYFELELFPKGVHYHNKAIKLNTARCAFEYILKAKGYKKVYLPYYTCDVMIEPICKLGLEYEFYHIDKSLNPIFKRELSEREVFLYTNYYGIKQKTVETLVQQIKNIIVDNSQAFFAPVIPGIDMFYSARKFFGVPDGAYLYTDEYINEPLSMDYSAGRMSHLLIRYESGAEAGYNEFRHNDAVLSGQPIMKMSKITDALLSQINYEEVKKKREENFIYLHYKLGETNSLVFDNIENAGPMVYPYLCVKNGLRQKLIENKIFVATYWPNVKEWVADGVEQELVTCLLPLPIDQRVTKDDIDRMVEIILK